MTESKEHHDLIDVIVKYVGVHFPEIRSGSFFMDRPGYDRPPALTGGVIPDFYCESSGYMIIGEAKTHDDICNDHTEKQFKSHLARAKTEEKSKDLVPVIIYAVPNDVVHNAKNFLTRIQKKDKCESIELKVTSHIGLSTEEEDVCNINVHHGDPIILKMQAFDYQKQAVEKIKNLEYAAIFHEQGLGKSKIAIDLLTWWLYNNKLDTVVVVTKKSLLYNWDNEFRKHTNLKPRILRGKGDYYIFNGTCRVILANYEIVRTYEENFGLFTKTRAVGIILDESVKIKNPNSKLTQAFFRLAPFFKKRVIMTGTPVSNRPYDIWAQIYFLDSGKSLGNDFKAFQKETDLANDLYENEEKQKEFVSAISSISEKIKDFTIRETKNSGIIKLPDKEYFTIGVPFEPAQKELYDKIQMAERLEVIKDGNIVIDDEREVIKRLGRLIEVASNPRLVDESYPHIPGKVKKLRALLKEIDEREEKTIVWTSYLKNVDLIKSKIQEFHPVTITGKQSMVERDNSVKKFINDPETKVLIATPAAKEGLTLTVANNAIFYDRSLSLDDYLQAQDRIHRISQTQTCYIYNLRTIGSIDEWVDRLIASKNFSAKLSQGDISEDDYNKNMDYSYGEIIKKILGVKDD